MATTEHNTSRRGVIAALAGTPFLVGTFAIAAEADAATGNPLLEALWREYRAAQRLIYSTPNATDAETRDQAHRLDRAESAILDFDATTPRGAAIKLWVSLTHMNCERWTEEAIAFGDFAEVFRREAELDFPDRLTVHAIRALGWEG
jgi:hypothetical protein